MAESTTSAIDQQIEGMDAEQLTVGKHELHKAPHFAGLYAAENVAGTEFIFGATFVILGASIVDVIIGLAIGNLLAVLSFRFLAAPIAVGTRLSVYTYLSRIAGGVPSKVFNALNAFLFAIISAAMITVSATAFRLVLNFEPQTEPWPTSISFIILALAFGSVTVLVAAFGFHALAEFASICAPWLVTMFAVGGLVVIPAVADAAIGTTVVSSWGEFLDIGRSEIFTGKTPEGEAGITLLGIIGYSWAANSFAHSGMIDMSLLRYAKKSWYGYMSATGMFLGHYMAWIAAGFMGAAAAAIVKISIVDIEPGNVAFQSLGYAGLIVVVVAGWTTANANLYRSGLAAQGVVTSLSRRNATLAIGVIVLIAAAFPFVYRNYLIFITYSGITLVPVGAILFASYWILPRMGMTTYWARYKGVTNVPALLAWAITLALAGSAVGFGLMPVYFAFVPAFIISAVLYVVFAKMMGAAESYPDGEAEDERFDERVAAFHERQAEKSPVDVDTTDRRSLTKALRVIWIVDLLVVFAMGVFVLFGSPDTQTYEAHRDQFFWVAFIGTLVYFAAAYWELRRRKAVAQEVTAEYAEQPA